MLEDTYEALLKDLRRGGTHIVTGKNGAGKSRFFSFASEVIAKEVDLSSSVYSKLVCLSGTMHDKYSRQIYIQKGRPENIVYLGNKVNNNMVSDIAPFRVLVKYVLDSENEAYHYSLIIRDFLLRLNLESVVKFKFRYGKGRKNEFIDVVESDLTIDLIAPQQTQDVASNVISHIGQGNILLSDVLFRRSGTYFGLNELSSGEKQYILSVFGVAFCGARESIVFFDEPENSLHPAWQLRIANDIVQILNDIHKNSTLVIATHSPLVASSFFNNNIFICEFPLAKTWDAVRLYGRSSDSILREQFHLTSARSPEVSEIINVCLSLIAMNKSDSQSFKVGQNKLRSMNLSLTSGDPLNEVVATILGVK